MGEVSSLIALKGDSNIDSWNRALRIEFNCVDLLEYVIEVIVEPDKATKPNEYKV